MSNYPPGTGPGDPNAPWNDPEPPKCPTCRRRIYDLDDHDEGCPDGNLDATDLMEAAEDAAADAAYERHREQQWDR